MLAALNCVMQPKFINLYELPLAMFFKIALRGPKSVKGGIFHLWTDPDEINTTYVKLKENYFLFMRIF